MPSRHFDMPSRHFDMSNRHFEKVDILIVDILTVDILMYTHLECPRPFKCSLFYAWKTYSLGLRRQGFIKTLSWHHICDAGTKSSRSLSTFMLIHRASNHKIKYVKYVKNSLNSKGYHNPMVGSKVLVIKCQFEKAIHVMPGHPSYNCCNF